MNNNNEIKSVPWEKNSYKKRPLWQWAVTYLVVALVAYGLIYYVVRGIRGMYTTDTTQSGVSIAQTIPGY